MTDTPQPRVDPHTFAKALGAEYVAEVDGILGGLNLYLMRQRRLLKAYQEKKAKKDPME